MSDRFVKNLRALVAAITLVATLLVALHHDPVPTESPVTRAAVEISQPIGHSHDSKGAPVQAEDHSHPHCVLPCTAVSVQAVADMPLSVADEFGRGQAIADLFRPPRHLAL